jgi:hypothetical protein
LRDDRLYALKLAALDLAGGKLLEERLRHAVELLVNVGELGSGASLCEPHKIDKPHQMHRWAPRRSSRGYAIQPTSGAITAKTMAPSQ